MRMRSPECQRIAMLEAYGYRTDSHFLLANLLKKPVRPWPDRPDRPLRPCQYDFKERGVDLEVEGVRYIEMHRGYWARLLQGAEISN